MGRCVDIYHRLTLSRCFPNLAHRSMALVAALALLVTLPGCLRTDASASGESTGRLEKIWGRQGNTDGRFRKPRAIAIDRRDTLYIVDKTARIQAFDREGNFLRSWTTPTHENGCPTGLGVDRHGNILVPDTHYYRVLTYTPQGELIATLGGTSGHGPGEFGWVTDAVEDSRGNLYVAEYGEFDRIQKFSPEREYLLEWGEHGVELGQFARPQDLAIDAEDRIWVADACNHRIQVFDPTGKLLFHWGQLGQAPGELYYPYDLELDGEGHVYVCEYGNHRVQKFTLDGRSLGIWGHEGSGPGELFNPWALVRDSHGKIHVLDSNNHRVQVISL